MHEVNTLVRMDALKFFEVSTLQSVVARQKAPYKLFDPVIELPIFDGLGVFPNWRRKPDVIYNQSIIFLQAAIMPTAADLGNSVRLQYDRGRSCGSSHIVKEARKASDLDLACELWPMADQTLKVLGQVSVDWLGRLSEYHQEDGRLLRESVPRWSWSSPRR
jgi:hypothetical protein